MLTHDIRSWFNTQMIGTIYEQFPTWIPNRAHGDTFATHIYMPHENGSALMDLFAKHTMSNENTVDLV